MSKKKSEVSKLDSTHWSMAANLEEQSMRLDRAAGVLYLVAEHGCLELGEDAGNALWAAIDIVNGVRDEMDRLGSEHMKLHRQINNIPEVKI